MGLIINPKDQALLERIAARERAPMYVVGKVTEDHLFIFVDEKMTQNQSIFIWMHCLEVHPKQ